MRKAKTRKKENSAEDRNQDLNTKISERILKSVEDDERIVLRYQRMIEGEQF